MKNQSHSNHFARPLLALALAFGIWAPLQAQSDMPMKDKAVMDGKNAVMPPPSAHDKGMMMDSKSMATEQAMMQQHHAMMADMKTQDAEIAAQLAKMNSAPADKKLDLLAALVTRLVEQRTAMNARMGMMQGEIMKCTMPDMAMGTPSAMNPPAGKDLGLGGRMSETKK
jgi:hypothetical protein